MYTNPYDQTLRGGEWLKSSFHIHCGTGKGTCGSNDTDTVLTAYKEAGYQLLTVSNHDLFTDTEKYREEYGLILFNGFEYSTHPHMLCIKGKTAVQGFHQRAIDQCRQEGGFVILCHPNWQHKEYWPFHELDNLTGYTGIEIYNQVIFRLSGSGLATDTWDYLLSDGKLVWGFANDDFHIWSDLGKAWNMVYTSDKTDDDIYSSLLQGKFYATTGLRLNHFDFDGERIFISANAGKTYVEEYEYLFIGKDGVILDRQNGKQAEYRFTGEESYVRIQVVSEHGAMLWTQPVYKTSLFRKP